jgi:hypothetical protein
MAYCLRQQLNQSNTRRRSYPTMPAAHHDTTQRLHAATRAVFSLSLRWLDHDPAPFRCLLLYSWGVTTLHVCLSQPSFEGRKRERHGGALPARAFPEACLA